jgi:hypothetical protein
MTRKLPLAVALIMGLFIAASASATTYYIAANGNDSNTGTSTSSPWLHAPGMPSCSGTCASTSPKAGDSLIFRGGDTWHFRNANLSPYTGGAWTWNWSGSSAGCQLNPSAGSVVKTSCIYIGVDQSWYSGASFARPIFTQDNPANTSRPTTCSYDAASFHTFYANGQNYWILDNIEWVGECWATSINAQTITANGTGIQITNNYRHRWTYASGASDDTYAFVGGNMPKANYISCDHNVIDGSDSSLGNTAGAASGMVFYNSCKEIAYNFISHVSNGCICNPSSVHDNVFQYLYEPQGATHGNIVEWNNPNSATGPVVFYNNVMRHSNEGIGVDFEQVTSNLWMFNNVSYHYRESSNGANGTDGTNCFIIDSSGASFYIFNNTIDYPCKVIAGTTTASIGIFQNNDFIGYSNSGPVGTSNLIGSPTPSFTDNGNEIFQSESSANSQGYTVSNNYAPTSGTGASVGVGTNLTTLLCNTIPDSQAAVACKSGTSAGVIEVSGAGGLKVSFPAIPIVARSAWDAGAYEFNSSSSSAPPTAPSGLVAVVQ